MTAHAPVSMADPDLCHEGRRLTAAAFLARMRGVAPLLGVTRLGRLTGLDRIGIPVWMAVRPNAANLSVTQGKGMDDDSAALSALMETVELALAERPHPRRVTAAPAELTASGVSVLPVERYFVRGRNALEPDRPIAWVEGRDLLAGATIWLPAESVGLCDDPGCLFRQASDGLGAGSEPTEAIVHGLCELIERDAMAMWSFRSPAEMAARELSPSLCGAEAAELAGRFATAGLDLRLFDITTDLAVPACLATVAAAGVSAAEARWFDIASGTGAAPTVTAAARRAMLEAAQSRLTTIAGARDDIAPDDYDRPLPRHLSFYLGGPAMPPPGPAPRLAPPAPDAPAQLAWLLDRLRAAGIRSLAVTSLDAEAFGCSVMRVLAPDLEQDPSSPNRRLGRRALAAMLGRR
jgi:ribosomal protein S12 methylthiotransferase accessory factor